MSDLAARVIAILAERSVSLASAESLTGGLIGATLTAVPGASRVYIGGTIAYATQMKSVLLGVAPDLIRRHTVISAEVALDMAVGLQERTDADWVIAVTGVAGPDGQDGHAPGEVWICVLGPRVPSTPQVQQVQRFDFAGDREEIHRQTVDAALGIVLRAASPV